MTIFADNQNFIFGESFYENGGQFGPLHETYFNLVVVHKGAVNVVADDLEHDIFAGQAGIIYSENIINLTFPRFCSTHISWCETGEILASTNMLHQLKLAPNTLLISNRLDSLIDMGVKLEHGEGHNYELLRNSIGIAVFHEYFYQVNLQEMESPLPNTVLRVKKYIDEHYPDNINLDSISQNAGISKQHLAYLYKKYLDCTPTQYLWKIRTENGAHLLTKTNLRVSEISDRCGFKNPYHFSRLIKLFYNYPPRELRQRNWNREPSTIKENVPLENLGSHS